MKEKFTLKKNYSGWTYKVKKLHELDIDNKKIYILLTCLVFLLLFTIFHRDWLFSIDLLFGHNWDFTFPDFGELGTRVIKQSSQAIGVHGEGALTLAHLPQNTIYSVLSNVLPVSLVIRITLFSCMILSFIGMWRLLCERADIKIASLGAFIYAYSPFQFSIIIAGSWYAWVAYAAAPFYISAFVGYFNAQPRRHLLILSLSHLFLLGFLQYYLLTCIVSIILVLSENKKLKLVSITTVYRAFLLLFILICLSANWILPLVDGMTQFYSGVISNPNNFGNFESVRTSTQNFISIYSLTGFVNRNFYIESLGNIEQLIYLLASTALLCGFIWIWMTDPKKTIKAPIILLLIMVMLVKGGNAPFGSFTISAYENVLLMKLYRSPQNIFFIVALLVPLIFVDALAGYRESRQKKIVILFFLLTSPILSYGWWKNGDLGSRALASANKSHVDFYKPLPELKSIVNNNLSRKLNHVEIFVPFDHSVAFKPNHGTFGGQGAEPNISYLKNTSPLFLHNSEEINESLKTGIPPSLALMHSIRYLTLRRDIEYHFKKFTPADIKSLWRFAHDNYESVYRGDSFETFKLSKEYFHPIVSTCSRHTVGRSMPDYDTWLNMSLTHALELICHEVVDSTPIDQGTTLSKIRTIEPQSPRLLEYRKLDPTRVLLRLHGVNSDKPVLIRIGSMYTENWRLRPTVIAHQNGSSDFSQVSNDLYSDDKLSSDEYKKLKNLGINLTNMTEGRFVSANFNGVIQNDNLENTKEWSISTWLQEGVGKHVKLSGYPYMFNGWILDPTEVIKKYPHAINDRGNGVVDIDLEIVNVTQDLLEIGILISLSTLFVLFVYGFLPYISRR